jgi:hypothetical protein
VGLSHPYDENSNVWMIDVLQINDAKSLLRQLTSINNDKTRYNDLPYLHLSMSKEMYEQLYSINPRSVPKIIDCNCWNNIHGKCIIDWNGKEHYNINDVQYFLEYKILFEPKK